MLQHLLQLPACCTPRPAAAASASDKAAVMHACAGLPQTVQSSTWTRGQYMLPSASKGLDPDTY